MCRRSRIVSVSLMPELRFRLKNNLSCLRESKNLKSRLKIIWFIKYAFLSSRKSFLQLQRACLFGSYNMIICVIVLIYNNETEQRDF